MWGTKKKKVWDTFKNIVHKFLGNIKGSFYKGIVQHVLKAYKAQEFKISLKINFLHSHTGCYPEKVGVYSEEQG